jgi:hypothetical protein
MLMNCAQKIEAAYNNTQTYTKCACQKGSLDIPGALRRRVQKGDAEV